MNDARNQTMKLIDSFTNWLVDALEETLLSAKHRVTSFYIIFIMSLCALYQFDTEVMQLDAKNLFLLISALLIIALLFKKRQKKLALVGAWCTYGIIVLIVIGLVIGKLQLSELFVVLLTSLVVGYAIKRESFHMLYVDVFLISAIVLLYGLLYRYLASSGFGVPITKLANNSASLLSFLVLVCALSSIRYCICTERKSQYGYAVVSGIGYFILFMNQNFLGILLMTIVFLFIPILFIPTMELIRRMMQLFFGFYFMLANMALLTNYTELLTIDLSYNLEASVYLDLGLAIIAFWFFGYWEKVSDDSDYNQLILYKMQVVAKYALGCISLLCVGVLLIKNQVLALQQENLFTTFLTTLDTQLSAIEGMYLQMYKQYGVAGIIATLACMLAIAIRIQASNNGSLEERLLKLIAILFIVQSFFYGIQGVTTPIYAVLVTMAIRTISSNE